MRSLQSCSGSWLGWSIQDAVRISESMRITFAPGEFAGEGTDKDGDFVLQGTFDADGNVTIDRRYTRTRSQNPETTVWVYPYIGRWDGTFISGFWHYPLGEAEGGPFEMWPANEEQIAELSLQEFNAERRALAVTNGVTPQVWGRRNIRWYSESNVETGRHRSSVHPIGRSAVRPE
ncbi:MAG: hypothetical protein SFX74_02150 [Fimbriimonadaceae bacterium]|nr:hypothetical protein [Fimbriimonadaceae bacterium]